MSTSPSTNILDTLMGSLPPAAPVADSTPAAPVPPAAPVAAAPVPPAAPAAPVAAAPVPPAAPAAPVAPVAPRGYWYLVDGKPTSISKEALQFVVNSGYTNVAMIDGGDAWVTVASLGFQRVLQAEVLQAEVLRAPPAPAAVVTTAPVVSAVILPESMHSLTTAVNTTDALALFAAMETATAENGQLATMVGEVADGDGGMSHSFPFATLKKAMWNIYKGLDKDVQRTLPAGDREYSMIYLAARLGASGWIGAGGAGATGVPPKYRFALPSVIVHPHALSMARDTMTVARSVQFTAKDGRVRFDGVGRLSVETHILGWRPDSGFIILVVPGYDGTVLTMEAIGMATEKRWASKAVVVSVKTDHKVNKKVVANDPKADNGSWDVYAADMLLATAPQDGGAELMQAWAAAKQTNPTGIAEQLRSFFHAADYKGLSATEVVDLLAEYTPLLMERDAVQMSRTSSAVAVH